jgi:hypothetical protein
MEVSSVASPSVAPVSLNKTFRPLDFTASQSISPTDIGAFQRLEGCERFLRLRLHTSNHDLHWLKKQGL